jgi:hypothetical protein
LTYETHGEGNDTTEHHYISSVSGAQIHEILRSRLTRKKGQSSMRCPAPISTSESLLHHFILRKKYTHEARSSIVHRFSLEKLIKWPMTFYKASTALSTRATESSHESLWRSRRLEPLPQMFMRYPEKVRRSMRCDLSPIHFTTSYFHSILPFHDLCNVRSDGFVFRTIPASVADVRLGRTGTLPHVASDTSADVRK